MSYMTCPNCSSTDLSWLVGTRVADNGGSIPDGRFKSSDLLPLAALGCNVCSETVWLAEAEDIAAMLPDVPSHGREPNPGARIVPGYAPEPPRGSVTPRATRDVVASTEFESGAPSPEAVALAEQVVAGEITAADAVAARLDEDNYTGPTFREDDDG